MIEPEFVHHEAQGGRVVILNGELLHAIGRGTHAGWRRCIIGAVIRRRIKDLGDMAGSLDEVQTLKHQRGQPIRQRRFLAFRQRRLEEARRKGIV